MPHPTRPCTFSWCSPIAPPHPTLTTRSTSTRSPPLWFTTIQSSVNTSMSLHDARRERLVIRPHLQHTLYGLVHRDNIRIYQKIIKRAPGEQHSIWMDTMASPSDSTPSPSPCLACPDQYDLEFSSGQSWPRNHLIFSGDTPRVTGNSDKHIASRTGHSYIETACTWKTARFHFQAIQGQQGNGILT
jgi:hypothetical protein